MNCLVVSATVLEIKPFIQHCRTTNKLDYIDLQLDFLVTGVGSINTTYALMKHLQVKKPDIVIMAGIAGAFDRSLSLGDVVVVKQESLADLGVHEKDGYKDVFDLKLLSANEFPFKQKKLVNPFTVLMERTKLPLVGSVTVNQITSAKKTAKLYQTKYKAKIENMEGAALHLVCMKENIPFVQIRSISNYVGERNKQKWKLKEAVQNLNKELIRLVEGL
ncbi:futalosine hydrolase [Lacibacter sp.]|uniref:futalosine hydrolase n=1 Tax=Lacibacter sp. TaxID=1915409 RepID=UPI002B4B8573|nr:futalosine hydrolase [Lacibacter sp.]HLP36624.1 futalosine hydrolase [Lacibacter sp.]